MKIFKNNFSSIFRITFLMILLSAISNNDALKPKMSGELSSENKVIKRSLFHKEKERKDLKDLIFSTELEIQRLQREKQNLKLEELKDTDEQEMSAQSVLIRKKPDIDEFVRKNEREKNKLKPNELKRKKEQYKNELFKRVEKANAKKINELKLAKKEAIKELEKLTPNAKIIAKEIEDKANGINIVVDDSKNKNENIEEIVKSEIVESENNNKKQKILEFNELSSLNEKMKKGFEIEKEVKKVLDFEKKIANLLNQDENLIKTKSAIEIYCVDLAKDLIDYNKSIAESLNRIKEFSLDEGFRKKFKKYGEANGLELSINKDDYLENFLNERYDRIKKDPNNLNFLETKVGWSIFKRKIFEGIRNSLKQVSENRTKGYSFINTKINEFKEQQDKLVEKLKKNISEKLNQLEIETLKNQVKQELKNFSDENDIYEKIFEKEFGPFFKDYEQNTDKNKNKVINDSQNLKTYFGNEDFKQASDRIKKDLTIIIKDFEMKISKLNLKKNIKKEIENTLKPEISKEIKMIKNRNNKYSRKISDIDSKMEDLEKYKEGLTSNLKANIDEILEKIEETSKNKVKEIMKQKSIRFLTEDDIYDDIYKKKFIIGINRKFVNYENKIMEKFKEVLNEDQNLEKHFEKPQIDNISRYIKMKKKNIKRKIDETIDNLAKEIQNRIEEILESSKLEQFRLVLEQFRLVEDKFKKTTSEEEKRKYGKFLEKYELSLAKNLEKLPDEEYKKLKTSEDIKNIKKELKSEERFELRNRNTLKEGRN